MRTSHQIKAEVAVIKKQLVPLIKEGNLLERELEDALSREFIEANNINKDDVQMSSGKGIPWLNTVYHFGEWLKTNSKKRWAEWNGRIYRTDDLIAGRMPDTNGLVEHLK